MHTRSVCRNQIHVQFLRATLALDTDSQGLAFDNLVNCRHLRTGKGAHAHCNKDSIFTSGTRSGRHENHVSPQHHRTVRFQRLALAGVELVPHMLVPGIAQVQFADRLTVLADTTWHGSSVGTGHTCITGSPWRIGTRLQEGRAKGRKSVSICEHGGRAIFNCVSLTVKTNSSNVSSLRARFHALFLGGFVRGSRCPDICSSARTVIRPGSVAIEHLPHARTERMRIHVFPSRCGGLRPRRFEKDGP